MFCACADNPPILSGSRPGSAASGVGTLVWNDKTLPTLHCVPDVGSRRITVRENDTEVGRLPKVPGDAVLARYRGDAGEVRGGAGEDGVAPGPVGVTGRT